MWLLLAVMCSKIRVLWHLLLTDVAHCFIPQVRSAWSISQNIHPEIQQQLNNIKRHVFPTELTFRLWLILLKSPFLRCLNWGRDFLLLLGWEGLSLVSDSLAGICSWEIRFKPEYEQHGPGWVQGWFSISANWEKLKTIYDQEMIPVVFTFCCSTNINHQMALGRQQ